MSEFVEPDPSAEIPLPIEIPLASRRAFLAAAGTFTILAVTRKLDNVYSFARNVGGELSEMADAGTSLMQAMNMDPQTPNTIPGDEQQAAVKPEAAIPQQTETIQPAVQPTETTPSEEPQIVENPELTGVVDSWMLAPNYRDIINSLDKTPAQKDYMIRVVNAVFTAMSQGHVFNPRMLTTQVVIETGWGRDAISGADEGNNLIGIKAGKDDPYVVASGTEFINGKEVFISDIHWKAYPSAADSIIDYAGMFQRLWWYEDAVNCRYDDELFMRALVDERDPSTCALIHPQGYIYPDGTVVKSYATDPDYVEKNLKMRDDLRLAEIFVQVK